MHTVQRELRHLRAISRHRLRIERAGVGIQVLDIASVSLREPVDVDSLPQLADTITARS
jgi:hypothetical protein